MIIICVMRSLFQTCPCTMTKRIYPGEGNGTWQVQFAFSPSLFFPCFFSLSIFFFLFSIRNFVIHLFTHSTPRNRLLTRRYSSLILDIIIINTTTTTTTARWLRWREIQRGQWSWRLLRWWPTLWRPTLRWSESARRSLRPKRKYADVSRTLWTWISPTPWTPVSRHDAVLYIPRQEMRVRHL